MKNWLKEIFTVFTPKQPDFIQINKWIWKPRLVAKLLFFLQKNCLWNLKKNNTDKVIYASHTQRETWHIFGQQCTFKWILLHSINVPEFIHQKGVFIFKGVTPGSHALVSILLPNIFGALSKLPSQPVSNSFRGLYWQQMFTFGSFPFWKQIEHQFL